MKNKVTGIICAAVTLLYLTVIFILSSQDGNETARLSTWLAEWLAGWFSASPGPAEINAVHLWIRKVAHVIVFGGAGGLITLSFSLLVKVRLRYCVLFSTAVTAAAAFFDEWHKQFIAGRHFDMPEAFLNAFSGLLGIFLAAVIVRRRRSGRDI